MSDPLAPSGFLVLLKCAFSDKPLRLFGTREDAVAYASQVRTDHAPRPQPRGCLGPPGLSSRPIAVCIIPFTGGLPGEEEPVVAPA